MLRINIFRSRFDALPLHVPDESRRVSAKCERTQGVLPIVGNIGRLPPKGVPFLSSHYTKG